MAGERVRIKLSIREQLEMSRLEIEIFSSVLCSLTTPSQKSSADPDSKFNGDSCFLVVFTLAYSGYLARLNLFFAGIS
jgi:hypothetical protein